MNAVQFEPAALPARDQDGWTFHPDLEQFLVDADGNPMLENDSEDCHYDHAKMAAAGWDSCVVDFDDDAPVSIRTAYDAGAINLADWDPTSPTGDGWRLVAVGDTEDGPKAMFVRPAQ